MCVCMYSRCTFCKEESIFSEEELNIHYWKYCPLLMRCEQCSEVIEIMGLRHHLISTYLLTMYLYTYKSIDIDYNNIA